MAAFAVAVATGDIIKYQLFVYGSFVWVIQVRYHNNIYNQSLMYVCNYSLLELDKNIYVQIHKECTALLMET